MASGSGYHILRSLLGSLQRLFGRNGKPSGHRRSFQIAGTLPSHPALYAELSRSVPTSRLPHQPGLRSLVGGASLLGFHYQQQPRPCKAAHEPVKDVTCYEPHLTVNPRISRVTPQDSRPSAGAQEAGGRAGYDVFAMPHLSLEEARPQRG